jgi:hypothetical protein
MTLFRLKAIVMLVVTAVWVIYILSTVLRGKEVGLQWLGLPGAIFVVLFGVVRRRNGNGGNGS